MLWDNLLGKSIERCSEKAGARRRLQQAEVDVEDGARHLAELAPPRHLALLRFGLQELTFHFLELLFSLLEKGGFISESREITGI